MMGVVYTPGLLLLVLVLALVVVVDIAAAGAASKAPSSRTWGCQCVEGTILTSELVCAVPLLIVFEDYKPRCHN